MHTDQSGGRPDITAWKQAFGLLAFSSATDAAEVVVAGFRETEDPAEQDKWMEIADCLNAIHASRTAH